MLSLLLGNMMRLLKILSILFIVGCAEENKTTLVRDVSVRPIFMGRCSGSLELGCRACLYMYEGKWMIMCQRVGEE